MLDLFPDADENKIWKIYISYPKDCKDYNTFISRLDKSNEAFQWKDLTSESSEADAIDKSDILIILSGLWNDNKKLIMNHVNYAKTFDKPIVIIRPYGEENIPPELEEVATRVVGWNTACIVDAILISINGDDYEFMC